MRNLRSRAQLGSADGLAWLLRFVIVAGSAIASPIVVGANAGSLDPTTDYRITYQTGANAAQTLESVKITDIVEIGSRNFLVVYLGGYSFPGYIDLESVRSILPNVR